MCNDEDPILNISQAERGRKERLLTEIAQNYLGERGFKAIPQFTIHRTFEYRIHPGNELREAIEKDVFFNENLVSGGVWNTEISYRNGYEHRLDVLGIGYGMELCGIEIKSCWDDFRTDKKWPSYMDFLNRMYILADEPTAVKIAAYLKDPTISVSKTDFVGGVISFCIVVHNQEGQHLLQPILFVLVS